MATIAKVEMTTEKKCKSCVKYRSPDDEAAMSNAYIENTAFPGGMPAKVFIVISDEPIRLAEDGDATAPEKGKVVKTGK